MTKTEGVKGDIERIYQKAKRSIQAARRLLGSGDYDFASSRAYYATFYAMQAALLTMQVTYTKHSGVIAAFNQHFVKTGILPKETSKIISRLFRERQMGDYDFESSITKNEALRDVELADEFLAMLRKLILD